MGTATKSSCLLEASVQAMAELDSLLLLPHQKDLVPLLLLPTLPVLLPLLRIRPRRAHPLRASLRPRCQLTRSPSRACPPLQSLPRASQLPRCQLTRSPSRACPLLHSPQCAHPQRLLL